MSVIRRCQASRTRAETRWGGSRSLTAQQGPDQLLADPEDGEIVHDFTDPEWDTGFLGDLYQDLSEHETSAYALLQTPDFIEEFILDHTLEPAVDEFGLADLRVIDPVCGSGTFLLSAFRRLLDRWKQRSATAGPWDVVRSALASIHGVDKNPIAVSITRFRLTMAAMRAGGARRFIDARISALSSQPEIR